ncbi:MAG: nucleotidyltransferase domain-containing protein [Gemmatimonadaceae bacterium]
MTSWSPELELVARLARPHPSPDDDARARALAGATLDWDRLLALASHHGVAPLVDAALLRLDVDSVPAETRQHLRKIRLASTSADFARYHRWLQLCRAFEARAIPAVTLKGFPVVLAIYGQVGLRPVGDLDFLVRRRDVSTAQALLEAMGYQLTREWQAALRNVGLNRSLDAAQEMTFVSARGATVDLHWKAAPTGTTPPGEELIAGAGRLRVEDVDVLVPAPDVAMLLLLVHGHISSWSRLRWLVDVAEGIERLSPAQHETMVRRLDALGMRDALAYALHLIRSLWGRLPTPSRGSAGLADAVQPRLLHYQMSVLERAQDWAHVHDRWRALRMLRQRIGSTPSLLAAIASAARPSHQDWAVVALPASLRLGYYVVRPIRVARAALAARGGRAVAAARHAQVDEAQAEPEMPQVTAASRQVVAMRGGELGATAPFTFVTAVYDSEQSSLLGGRGRGIAYYLPSLINIANLGAPVVVFCPHRDVRAIEDALAPYVRDHRVIPCELSEFEHFDAFVEWKQTYVRELPINDRNEVLCFLKSYWLQRAIADRPFGHDTYFWIDAGLTHHGIFPERVGGVELRVAQPASHYFPRNPANIFTPDLGAALAQAVPRGRVLFCAHPLADDTLSREACERVLAGKYGQARGPVRVVAHLVGGLFGGHGDDWRVVHGLYTELLEEFIATRTYTLEEQVFSGVHALHPELFSLQRFDTWWFHSPGERTSYLAAEGNSFYRIFTRLLARGAPA